MARSVSMANAGGAVVRGLVVLRLSIELYYATFSMGAHSTASLLLSRIGRTSERGTQDILVLLAAGRGGQLVERQPRQTPGGQVAVPLGRGLRGVGQPALATKGGRLACPLAQAAAGRLKPRPTPNRLPNRQRRCRFRDLARPHRGRVPGSTRPDRKGQNLGTPCQS